MAKQTKMVAALGAASVALGASGAFASGYEKTVLWSGRYSGAAGITAGNAEGAEALAFNPAGILTGKQGHELSANLSVVQSQFKGPIGADNVTSDGETTYVAPFALIYAGNLNEKVAFAIGSYTAGGAKAEYNNVAFPYTGGTNPVAATVKTDLAIQEISAGAAYKPMDKLRIGAAWRVSMARANFASWGLPAGANTAMANIEFSDLKDTQWLGYRLGAQWADDNWGVGIMYRSEVEFKASGDASGRYGQAPSTTLSIPSTSATLTTQLPMQINVGGWYDVMPKTWRALAEYSFTNYSRVDQIGISGQYQIGPQTRQFTPMRMNWNDQHIVRLGGEYGGFMLPIRFGYAWTSQVTSSDYARATFTPAGPANTFTLGTGMDFMDGALRANAGFDYTTASGGGRSNPAEAVRAGDYSVNAYALHVGASYMF